MGEGHIISYDKIQEYLASLKVTALPEPIYGSLTFKRAFWVIASAIFANQVFGLSLWAYYDFDDVQTNYNYHLISGFVGLGWYVIVTVLILADLENNRVLPNRVFALSWKKLQETRPTLIKYFGIMAITMILLSTIMPSESLIPDISSPLITALVIISTVVAAPICEEIWFRGYLYSAGFSIFRRPRERMVVNAMLFAAAHVFLVTFFLGAGVPYYIFVLGYLIAHLYETSRSILPCILLHALNNGLALILEYLDPYTLVGFSR
jgi:membrane protease YdiL (CAAX protease family)